jgi:tRNA G26 N,N-dimethylase Trm1
MRRARIAAENPVGIAVLAPVSRQHPGLARAAGHLDVRQLVAQTHVEGLYLGVCQGEPGSSRQCRSCTAGAIGAGPLSSGPLSARMLAGAMLSTATRSRATASSPVARALHRAQGSGQTG